MTTRTVPFHNQMFYHAMIALLGRGPDSTDISGDSNACTFRYEPRDEAEKNKFAEGAATLRNWLSIFELMPLHSRCDYGRLTNPEEDEENKDYLYIKIVPLVEKKEGR